MYLELICERKEVLVKLERRYNHTGPENQGMKKKTHTQGQTHSNICTLHHPLELLETNLPIPILIRLHDRLVHNLLQLHILQVTPHHHLEHDEQFPVGDVTVPIDVVDFKSEKQLLFFVPFGTECRQAGYEFLEVDVSASVFVEDCDHSVSREG